MATWNAQARVGGAPGEVLELLTVPEAIARWSPVDFEVTDMDGERLVPGGGARVTGRVAGIAVGFDVRVLSAGEDGIALAASGPVDLDVLYELRAARHETEVHASVSVRRGRGLTGRVVAQATDALLAAGALRAAMGRMAQVSAA